jgi:protoporphyrinogen IX oxidase
VLGLILMVQISAYKDGWFHLKLLMVLALSGYHGWMAGYAKKLAGGERTMTDKQLRLANEVPGIAAAIIVILVIVKPF